MNQSLLHVYNLMNMGEITQAQAAQALGYSEENLKWRLSRHGNRIPLILATLDKIHAAKITRLEAAEVLGVSTRQVNKLMESWKIVRPLNPTMPYLVNRAESEVKFERRKHFAIEFIAGKLNFEKAAEAADCSTRQIRRWVSDLLEKHFEMPYKDLVDLELPKRARLASEIRTAEQLEKAKQSVINAIADGHLDAKDEAINRVLAKRSIQHKEKQ